MFEVYPETARAFITFPCVEVAPGGKGIYHTEFPILRVDADLPECFDAIVVLGDMQAVDDVYKPVESRDLLGLTVAREFGLLAELGLLTEPERTLIVLTGDLFTYAALDRRGGSGDVLPIYRAFAKSFPNVCAVAGNHDLFGTTTDIQSGSKTGVQVLHGTTISFGDFTVGGVCGIDGNNGKPWRNTEADLRKLLRTAAGPEVDLLLLHEPPKTEQFPGSQTVTRLLNRSKFSGTIVCGHVCWREPFDAMKTGVVGNFDGRGAIFARPDASFEIES